MTTWTIAVDWQRNNTFTDTNDNISAFVITANWFLGTRGPYREIADDSMLELTLDNSDRRFSPEYATSPLAGLLVPFRPVRIQSNDGTTTRTHWLGWIERIEPEVNINGKRTVKLIAAGPMQFLKAAETRLALQENQTANQIISRLLDEVVFPPALTQAWYVQRSGSALSTNTYLADVSAAKVLDTGVMTFAWAADNWVRRGDEDEDGNPFNVYEAIRDVTAAERGRFFFDREGRAVFWNRQHLLDTATVAATFDDSMQGLDYVYAGPEDLKNEIIITCHPRTIGVATNDILWQLTSQVRVPAGEKRTLHARYTDSSNNRIGARMVAVQDIVFSQGSASIVPKLSANGATLEITNNGPVEAILTGCSLRGQKITDFGQMEAIEQDLLSQAEYGRRTMKLNLRALDKLADAQTIAVFERTRRSQPRGHVKAVTLRSHGKRGSEAGFPGNAVHTQQLALTLGSRIVIKEAQTWHGKTASFLNTASYYVIGEAHRLSDGATNFETTWYLEPTP
jgi:hypothetical protein